jgi:hypothetical protein
MFLLFRTGLIKCLEKAKVKMHRNDGVVSHVFDWKYIYLCVEKSRRIYVDLSPFYRKVNVMERSEICMFREK